MKPTDQSPDRRKAWAKRLKISGAALLLFAFGMQMRQNSNAATSLERTQVAELQSRTKQKAIGYETLYFSAEAAGQHLPAYLSLAASQYFIGSAVMIGTSPGSPAEKRQTIGRLQTALTSVHDLGSFREYESVENEIEVRTHPNDVQGLIDPAQDAAYYGGLYLALYILGSAGAIAGQIVEPISK
jgi:hypothetical protein